jgi:hypothetical protein
MINERREKRKEKTMNNCQKHLFAYTITSNSSDEGQICTEMSTTKRDIYALVCNSNLF